MTQSSSYKNYLMNQLSAEEILNIQILLLQSPGKTLTTLHKRLLTPTTFNQIQILNQFDKKHLSLKLRKMIVANVQSTGSDANSNLRAFSIILLKLIFGKELDQEILGILKSHLHSKQINFTKVTNIAKNSVYSDICSLSDNQSKKILVEFLHSLQSASGQSKIQTQCNKYPLALELLVILWRTVLIKFKIPQAHNFSKKISTTAAYEILFEFLDVFYCKSGRLYLLRDQNLFIQNGYERDDGEFVEEITFGNYYENQDQYMQTMLKNMPLGIIGDIKLGTSAMASNHLTVKAQNLNVVNQTVSPFEMLLPKSSSIFDSTHSHNSNRSLKGSNAFERRNFNFSSNRSEASVNLEDSQCDNPTPSFNQVLEDQAHNSFRPKEESLDHGIPYRPNNRSHNFVMKESATIMPVRNKLLQSSLLEDLRLFEQSQKGSVQLEYQTRANLGLKAANEISGFQTNDSPVNNIIGISPFEDVLDRELKVPNPQPSTNKKPQRSSPNEQMKSMKRSHSEKNSMMKQSQIKDEEPIRQSLFSINCKKLKTSMQINDFQFGSQKKFSYRDAQQFNQRNPQDLCKHTNYSCSCHSLKLSKNKLISNTYNLTFKPLHLNQIDFKKKEKVPNIETKILENSQSKTKTKLNDQFFKNLRAKRQEERVKDPSAKNKSDPKLKGEKSYRKPYFIKYSQFIKMDDRSLSKSKTPNKSQRPTKKKTFPTNFKKLETFFYKVPTINPGLPGLKKFESAKQETRIISPKNTYNKTFESQKFFTYNERDERRIPNQRFTNVTNLFEFRGYPAYSTPSTPMVKGEEVERRINNNMNDSFEQSSHFQPVNQGKRKISFNFFSPKSSNGFGRNDNLFYNAETGKGEQKR